MKHKHGFTDPVPQNMKDGPTGNGVTTLHGHARFTGPHQLKIDGAFYGPTASWSPPALDTAPWSSRATST